MILVGLTGSIASGKSTVASCWAERGAVVIDADRIGHEVIGKDGPGVQPVLAAFGPGIRGPDGGIDRRELGRRVFRDPALRRKLESIVHPRLLEEVEARIGQAGGSGSTVCVVDAALIFEFGIEESFDYVVVVTAPRARTIGWLKDRGLTEAEALARLAAQWTAEDKARRADRVISNAGSLEDLKREAGAVWEEILRKSPRPGGEGPYLKRKEAGS